MIDPVERYVAPAAIERAMSVFEQFKDRGRRDLVQARKSLQEHVYAQICQREIDEDRLVVSGLTHLKKLERQAFR